MSQNTILYLSAAEVRRALSMPDCIDAMRDAFVQLSCGQIALPARTHLDIPDDGGIALFMPCYSAGRKLLGLKLITLFDGNHEKGIPYIHALVTLADGATGMPVAVMDGTTITALRTGAASGVATDMLARPDAEVAAIFGAGVQARTQLEAVCCVRPIRLARVYDADAVAAERFAAEMSERLIMQVERAATPAEALKDAAVVCTVTTSRTPVFEDHEVAPGTHINAVGSYKPEVREIPPETVCRARIVVDHYESAMVEAGDLLMPLRAGVLRKDQMKTELGEIVAGHAPRRQDAKEITLFKSVGVAIQDLFAASRAVEHARQQKLGVELPR